MKLAMVVLGCALALGCGDDGPTTPADLTCTEIAAQLKLHLATTSRTCGTQSDCIVAGGGVDRTGLPTCNCTVFFAAACGGDPVNNAAWTANAAAQALETEWFARCTPMGCGDELPGIFDCAPSFIDCVSGVCVANENSCF